MLYLLCLIVIITFIAGWSKNDSNALYTAGLIMACIATCAALFARSGGKRPWGPAVTGLRPLSALDLYFLVSAFAYLLKNGMDAFAFFDRARKSPGLTFQGSAQVALFISVLAQSYGYLSVTPNNAKRLQTDPAYARFVVSVVLLGLYNFLLVLVVFVNKHRHEPDAGLTEEVFGFNTHFLDVPIVEFHFLMLIWALKVSAAARPLHKRLVVCVDWICRNALALPSNR
jgi:hypothetical protein